MEKHYLLVIITFFFIVTTYGQNKEMVSASIYLREGQLAKAKDAIDLALKHEKTKNKTKTLVYAGRIYSELYFSEDVKFNNLDKDALEKAYLFLGKAFEIGIIDDEMKELATSIYQAIEDEALFDLQIARNEIKYYNRFTTFRDCINTLSVYPADIDIIDKYAASLANTSTDYRTYLRFLPNGIASEKFYNALVKEREDELAIERRKIAVEDWNRKNEATSKEKTGFRAALADPFGTVVQIYVGLQIAEPFIIEGLKMLPYSESNYPLDYSEYDNSESKNDNTEKELPNLEKNKQVHVRAIKFICDDTGFLTGDKTFVYWAYLTNGEKVSIQQVQNTGKWYFRNGWGEKNRGSNSYSTQEEILNAIK